MEKHHTPEELIRKYNAGTCTDEERAIVDSWHLADLRESNYVPSAESVEMINARMRETVLAHADAETKTAKLWPRIISVAAAVAAIAFGIWFFSARNHTSRPPELVSGPQDIAPGKNMATLSLAGGKAITLSDAHSGVVINASQIKYSDGSLVQNSSSGGVSSAGVNRILTVTTPRGGTYQITLPDGTKVWLNAASSLTYHAPLNDRGGVRKVELVGEAYFEVFRNKLQPFVVNSKKMELTVLGTHFNVNAYGDESSIKATLLEGSVRVRSSGGKRREERGLPSAGDEVVLKPNQQAIVKENSIDYILVNAEEAVAWKNGEFVFRSQRIADIMRNVKRWYDVDVVFESNSIADKTFTADISRYDNISKLLDILQKTGKVKFRIEGRTVYVSE